MGVEELGRCRPSDRFRAVGFLTRKWWTRRGGPSSRCIRPRRDVAMALSVAVGADCARGPRGQRDSEEGRISRLPRLGRKTVISRGPAGAAAAGAGARARARAGRERPVPAERWRRRRLLLSSRLACRRDRSCGSPLAAARRLGARWPRLLRPVGSRLLCVRRAETGPLQARAKFLLDRRDLTALRAL